MERGRSLESKGSSLESSQRAKRVSIRSRSSSISASDFAASVVAADDDDDDESAIFAFLLKLTILCVRVRNTVVIYMVLAWYGLDFWLWTRLVTLL